MKFTDSINVLQGAIETDRKMLKSAPTDNFKQLLRDDIEEYQTAISILKKAGNNFKVEGS